MAVTTIRRRGRAPIDASIAALVIQDYLCDQVATVSEIAERHGVTKQTLYNILRRNGVDFNKKIAPVSSNDSGGSTVPEGEPQSQTRSKSTLEGQPTHSTKE